MKSENLIDPANVVINLLGIISGITQYILKISYSRIIQLAS